MRKISVIQFLILAAFSAFLFSCKKDDTTELKEYKLQDIDGNTYKAVKIGEQIFMAENLRTTKYNDGTPISKLEDIGDWYLTSKDAFCWYNNDSVGSVENNYGALYNSSAVRTEKLCPKGWHVPSISEWRALIKYVNSNGYANNEGIALKSVSGWKDDANGEDIYDFNGTPAPTRFTTGVFGSTVNTSVSWWSKNAGTYYMLSSGLDDFKEHNTLDDRGICVRCIQD